MKKILKNIKKKLASLSCGDYSLSMNKLTICGCEVQKQLNGTSVYVLFSGTEESILNAFNTLYAVHCFDGELEFLNNGLAYVTATPKQFLYGLRIRQELRMCVDGTHKQELMKFKGVKGGGLPIVAQELATADWNAMECVYFIKPLAQAYSYFRMAEKQGDLPEWATERSHAITCE